MFFFEYTFAFKRKSTQKLTDLPEVKEKFSFPLLRKRTAGAQFDSSFQHQVLLMRWTKLACENIRFSSLFSLRSRRLEVAGERENGRARGRHARVSPSRAPVFSCGHYFQAPATQAKNNFQLMPWQVIAILKEYSEKNWNVKNVFENLIWLRRYDIVKINKCLKIVGKWRKIRNSRLNNFSTN